MAVYQLNLEIFHDDVIKWKHFPRYWPFVRGIHRSPVNSPHNGQWRGALMLTLICARINGWVNNREAGDLRRPRAHYDVTVMFAADLLRALHDMDMDALLVLSEANPPVTGVFPSQWCGEFIWKKKRCIGYISLKVRKKQLFHINLMKKYSKCNDMCV